MDNHFFANLLASYRPIAISTVKCRHGMIDALQKIHKTTFDE
jgi:hypothetical protein